MRWVLIPLLILCPAVPVWATTYYVSPSGSGIKDGLTRETAMAFATFRDTTSVPGDIALLQPGSYGAFNWVPENSPFGNRGTAADRITYRADPATTTPRAADWFTRTTALPTPDPATQPVFDSFHFGYNRTAGDWNTAAVAGLTLDGLFGYGSGDVVTLYATMSHITLTNMTIMSPVTYRVSTTPAQGFYLRYNSGNGGDLHDIEISNCYVQGSVRPYELSGRLTSNITFTHNRAWETCGSGLFWNPVPVAGYTQSITDCRFERRISIAADTGASYTRTITAVDAVEPRRIFTISAAVSATYMKWVDITDVSTGAVSLKQIESYNAGTSVVTLVSAVDFDLQVDTDTGEFYNGPHESGLSLYSGELTIDRCLVRSSGGSGPVYNYCLVAGGIANLHIYNSLFYCPGSSAVSNIALVTTQSAYSKLGYGFEFINNTVLGGYTYYYDLYSDERAAMNHYNVGVLLEALAGTDKSTWVISNNLIPGTFLTSAHLLDDATVTCNHVYYHSTGPSTYPGLTELLATGKDVNAKNWGNVVIYAGEAKGAEPTPFSRGGTYFLATSADFDDVYDGGMDGEDFTADLYLSATSPALNAGDSDQAPVTDLDGTTRDGTPDVGAFESPGSPASPPTAATTPSPADEALNVLETATLSWTTGSNSPTHHVFFGTDIDAVGAGSPTVDKGTQAGTTYDPGTLDYNTDYYWRIQEENGDGTATGDVWTFHTRSAPLPVYYFIGGTY